MSEEHADRTSRMSGVAVLPWTVALLLFVLLAGSVALVAKGYTAGNAPPAVAESPADTVTAPAVEEDSASSQDTAGAESAPGGPETSLPGSAAQDLAQQDSAAPPAPRSELEPEPEPRADTATVSPPPPVPEQGAAPETSAEADGAQTSGTGAPAMDARAPDGPSDEPAPVNPPDQANQNATPGSAPVEQSGSEKPGSPESSDTAAQDTSPSAPAPEEAAPPETAPQEATPPETAPQVAAVPSPAPVTGRAPDALPPAPDPSLVEPSALGPLPRIGTNGREPWQAYARPVPAGDTRPKVAIILSGLGLSSAATEAAIQGLPGPVTLAFQPYADNVQQWIQLARAAGHEVLLNLPMEPVDFPSNDPGPRALFVDLTPEENQDRLRWALSRVSGYVGVLNHMGSRFTVTGDAMRPVLAELKARGLLFVDARSAANSVATVMASEMLVPRAINDRFLDNRDVSRVNIDNRLAEVEDIARETGVSLAIGQAFPVTIERIRAWTETLNDKGIALVPVSSIVDRQPDR